MSTVLLYGIRTCGFRSDWSIMNRWYVEHCCILLLGFTTEMGSSVRSCSPAHLHVTSVAVLAEISVRPPRKCIIFIIKQYIYRIKVSKKITIWFWKKLHCMWRLCAPAVMASEHKACRVFFSVSSTYNIAGAGTQHRHPSVLRRNGPLVGPTRWDYTWFCDQTSISRAYRPLFRPWKRSKEHGREALWAKHPGEGVLIPRQSTVPGPDQREPPQCTALWSRQYWPWMWWWQHSSEALGQRHGQDTAQPQRCSDPNSIPRP